MLIAVTPQKCGNKARRWLFSAFSDSTSVANIAGSNWTGRRSQSELLLLVRWRVASDRLQTSNSSARQQTPLTVSVTLVSRWTSARLQFLFEWFLYSDVSLFGCAVSRCTSCSFSCVPDKVAVQGEFPALSNRFCYGQQGRAKLNEQKSHTASCWKQIQIQSSDLLSETT